jgi:tetrahydromethanopterin S-methyltransferase subunit B
MISILNNDDVNACNAHADEWLNNIWPEYANVLCCKEVGGSKSDTLKTAFDHLTSVTDIEETMDELRALTTRNICSLPKGHTGRCSCSYYKHIFKSKTVQCKIDWIFCTPGNNDFVFKNRHSRLFPIRLSDTQEKSIRNKNIKLKCAIPLKDASTPQMIASAMLDYMTLMLNVKGVNEHIDKNNKYTAMIIPMIDAHKPTLSSFYASHNRTLFDADGFTLCPVTGRTLNMDDFFTDIDHPCGIQLGHVQPRGCQQYTVRGLNVLLMCRDGNRIIGDNNFLQDNWLTNIMNIVNFQKLKL